jgi:outer membrane protein TolC
VAPGDLQVIAPAPAPAQLSLDDALQLALQQNAGFRHAVQALLGARSDWYVARQRWALEAFGQVERAGNGETESETSAGAALSYAAVTGAEFSVTAELARLDDEEDVRTLAATLRQPLLASAGPASAAYEAVRSARNSYRAALLAFFSNRQDLIEQVISTYYDVAEQRELVRVQDTSVALAEQAVNDAQLRLEAQVTTLLDLTRAQLRLSREQSAAVNQRRGFQDSMDRLLVLLGLSVGAMPELTTTAPYESQEFEAEMLIARALELRPDLRLADLSIEDRQAVLRIARSRNLPSLDAFAGWSQQRDGVEDRSWNVGLSLSVPIGSRSLAESVRQARWSLLVSQQAREELRQQIAADIRRQVRSAEAARANVEISEQGLEVAKQSAQAAQTLFEEGLSTNRDLLDAQDEITRSERQLVSSRVSYYLALVRLKVAVGENLLAAEGSGEEEASTPSPPAEQL